VLLRPCLFCWLKGFMNLDSRTSRLSIPPTGRLSYQEREAPMRVWKNMWQHTGMDQPSMVLALTKTPMWSSGRVEPSYFTTFVGIYNFGGKGPGRFEFRTSSVIGGRTSDMFLLSRPSALSWRLGKRCRSGNTWSRITLEIEPGTKVGQTGLHFELLAHLFPPELLCLDGL
jgi:hypothetical protein